MATNEATSNVKRIQVRRFKPEEYPEKHYLNEEKGIWTWMTTVDHKKIGLMYLASITFFFFIAGVLASLLFWLLLPVRSLLHPKKKTTRVRRMMIKRFLYCIG